MHATSRSWVTHSVCVSQSKKGSQQSKAHGQYPTSPRSKLDKVPCHGRFLGELLAGGRFENVPSQTPWNHLAKKTVLLSLKIWISWHDTFCRRQQHSLPIPLDYALFIQIPGCKPTVPRSHAPCGTSVNCSRVSMMDRSFQCCSSVRSCLEWGEHKHLSLPQLTLPLSFVVPAKQTLYVRGLSTNFALVFKTQNASKLSRCNGKFVDSPRALSLASDKQRFAPREPTKQEIRNKRAFTPWPTCW